MRSAMQPVRRVYHDSLRYLRKYKVIDNLAVAIKGNVNYFFQEGFFKYKKPSPPQLFKFPNPICNPLPNPSPTPTLPQPLPNPSPTPSPAPLSNPPPPKPSYKNPPPNKKKINVL